MTISPRRKRIGAVLGLLLLAGLGAIAWPFMAGPDQMESFCDSLAAGSSLEQIQAQAAQTGYRVSALIEDRAFVHDSGSFGRFTCALTFEADGLASSAYFLNDCLLVGPTECRNPNRLMVANKR